MTGRSGHGGPVGRQDRSGDRRGIGWALGALALVLATACSLPQEAASSPTTYPTAAKVVTPAVWLRTACPVILAVQAADDRVFTGLDLAKGLDTVAGRTAVRTQLMARYAAAAARVERADRRLADVGTPRVTTGDELVDVLRAGFADTSGTYTAISRGFARLPVDSKERFVAGITKVAGGDQTSPRLAGAITSLRGNVLLNPARYAEPGCQAL